MMRGVSLEPASWPPALRFLEPLFGWAHPAVLVTLLVGIGAGLAYFRRASMVVLGNLRLMRIAHYLLMAFVGIIVYSLSQPRPDEATALGTVLSFIGQHSTACLLMMIATQCVAIAAITVNDIEDLVIDQKTNADRPLVEGRIHVAGYHMIGRIALAIGLLTAASVHFSCLLHLSLVYLLYYIYSCPPFKIKRIPLVAKSVIGMNSCYMLGMGFTMFGGLLSDIPMNLYLGFLISLTLAANFIDIKDYEGDQLAGIKTLPVLFGLQRGRLIICAFTALGYIIMGCILGGAVTWTLLILLLPVHIFFLQRKNYSEKPVFLTYFAFQLVIITKIISLSSSAAWGAL